jgi:signal transduction histidine kinase
LTTAKAVRIGRAAAERATPEEVERQAQFLASLPLVRSVFDAVPAPFFVVNRQRQVVTANHALLTMVGLGEGEVLGRRPGEVLGCVHSDETAGGCGTSEACQACGAVSAVLAAVGGREVTIDSRISLKNGDSLDLEVTATPMLAGEDSFVLVIALDNSDENRRRALERIFFHDVLNTAGGVSGLVDIIQEAPTEEFEELLQMLGETSSRLIDEIQSQRLLAAAESRDLTVRSETVQSRALLQAISRSYSGHEVAVGRRVVVDPESPDVEFVVDRTLLARVLGNLLKNALEACEVGMAVTLGCRTDESSVAFWVHNPMPMPLAVRLQIFQRSFSTKGSGRGLGTYSVKLLTERYLSGSVSFSSSDGEGTTFTVSYPRTPKAAV